MKYFLGTLRLRNEPLFYFGLSCLLAALVGGLLIRLTSTQVTGVNAWYQPFKFFVSLGVFAWTMGWYLAYLGPRPGLSWYAWLVVILLGLEVAYIAGQAGRGQRFHFEVGTPLYAALYGGMALAAVAVALATAYVGGLFSGGTSPSCRQPTSGASAWASPCSWCLPCRAWRWAPA